MVDVGGWCIDSTEVTQAQYAAFLSVKGLDTSGQTTQCSGNTSFNPDSVSSNCAIIHNPIATPNNPARCIDWCDAHAYCTWAGKRLCGDVAGGALTSATVNDPNHNQFLFACSNGGKTVFPYGNYYDESKCRTYQYADVKSFPECHGLTSPYSEAYDMADDMSEWIDWCTSSTTCGREGFTNEVGTAPAYSCAALRLQSISDAYPQFGFRCCSK